MTILRDDCGYLDASVCVKYMHREDTSNKIKTASAAKNTQRGDECVLTQQWRKPVDIGFTVGVQKRDDLPFGHGGAQQAGPDQPLPLLGPQNADLWQPHHVVLQRQLEVL